MEVKAANGDADAMFRLGVAHELGLDIKPNYKTAMAWYRRAADAGNTRAMTNLGANLAESADRASCLEGVALLEKAASAGESSAMYNIASMYGSGDVLPLNGAEEQRWRLRAGEAGNPFAMLDLGLAFQMGQQGVVKDRSKAIYWYRKAVEHNEGWRREAAMNALKDLGQ
jgi:TPR repeat protein